MTVAATRGISLAALVPLRIFAIQFYPTQKPNGANGLVANPAISEALNLDGIGRIG